MLTVTLGEEGAIPVPAEIRRLLRLHPGDRLDFVMDKGQVTLRLAGSLDTHGMRDDDRAASPPAGPAGEGRGNGGAVRGIRVTGRERGEARYDLDDLQGMLRRPGQPVVTLEEMDAAIARMACRTTSAG